MNIQLEQSVLASLDYANLAEYVSFGTADFNKIVDGLIAKKSKVTSRRLAPAPQTESLSRPPGRDRILLAAN